MELCVRLNGMQFIPFVGDGFPVPILLYDREAKRLPYSHVCKDPIHLTAHKVKFYGFIQCSRSCMVAL